MKTKREIMREIVETTLIKTATTDLEGRYHNGKGKNAIEMIIVQGHILVYKGKKKTEFNPWEIEEALDCFFEERRQTEDKSMSKNTKFELKELLIVLQYMNKESQKVYPYLKLNKNEKAKWKIGDRVEISFVDPRAKSHLVGDDYEPLSFTKGCKGTVIRHSDGHHDGIDYLIEFDERIGNLSLEYGKSDHCFWMNESKENGRLEKRLFMWDKPVLLECKSIKTDQIQMKNSQIFDENVEALYKMKSQEMSISNLLETIETL